MGEPPYHGRLNGRNGWCTEIAKDQWLQFDLGKILAVAALSIQGRYGRITNDMVSLFFISYANSSAAQFIHYGQENGEIKVLDT